MPCVSSRPQQTFGQWQKVFYIAAGIFLVDTIFYLIFASGRVQEWNQVTEAQKEDAIVSVDSPKAQPAAEKSPVWNITKEVASGTPGSKAYENYVVDPCFRSSYHNSVYQPN